MDTASTNISIYRNVKDVASADTIPIDLFLTNIREGHWQDQVLKIRTISDKEVRRLEKTKLPNVTISGIFGKRVDDQLKAHSGYIAIDLDDLKGEVESTRELLRTDPYVYSCFTSVGGAGLCCLFKIDTSKHKEAFDGIADYLIKKYQLIVDPTGINPSRARFVSYDPDLFVNDKPATFRKYLPKPKARKITTTIFVKTEFDDVVKQMVDQGISCVDDYRDWRDIGFGLADQFGEAGRHYFHALSSCSPKYETSMCDRQYTHSLLRNGRPGNKITIATIYWYAKQAGIQVFSERTKKIAAATSTLKKSGLDAKGIAENLAKFEQITDADDIIKQAFAANQSFAGQETLIENVRMWVRHNFDIKRNLITRKLENSGKELEDIDLNTLFLEAKILFDELTHDLFLRILLSRNTPQYNPILSWFADHEHLKPTGVIDKFFSAFKTDDDIEYFGKKWLVGAISSIYGKHSPLLLILAGQEINTGKTESFRRLLPSELSYYYAESKLDAGKDDQILMCQKWFIMDDEMGGKSKKENTMLKDLTSKQTFSLREPYGRSNVDLNRIAVLCGTTNELGLISDTANRRLLPMEIISIDFDVYNSVDKSELFMEAYWLWKEGFKWQLDKSDIDRLAGKTEKFNESCIEFDLINKYYSPGDEVELTATDIKVEIQRRTNERLSLKRIGMELKRIGFIQSVKKINKRSCRVYGVVLKDVILPIPREIKPIKDEDLPFPLHL